MRAEKEDINRDELFENYWSKFETDFWSNEIARAGRVFSRLDLGLRYFLMAKTGQLVDARRVNEEYRSWIGTSPPRYASVNDELADFSRFCDIFMEFESAGTSILPATDFRRVLADFEVSTALPLVMNLRIDAELDNLQVAACINVVESFIARRVIVGEENREYNKLFIDVIDSIRPYKGQKTKMALVRKLMMGGGSTRIWPNDASVVERAISRPIFLN